jgi:hypothetical protein
VSQSKQIQLDDLLGKLDGATGELERLRDEKDQEIAILQEGMDTTLQQLSEVQQVGFEMAHQLIVSSQSNSDSRFCG